MRIQIGVVSLLGAAAFFSGAIAADEPETHSEPPPIHVYLSTEPKLWKQAFPDGSWTLWAKRIGSTRADGTARVEWYVIDHSHEPLPWIGKSI